MTATIAANRLSVAIATDRAVQRIIGNATITAMPLARAHEAVRPSRSRRIALDEGSANRIVGTDAKSLRDSARDLTRNYDVAKNAVNILVQNTVGSGIDVMPVPRKAGGKVDRELAQQLRDLWDDWWDKPEVTGQHDFGKCQQLMVSSAMRDGEAFFQHILGFVPTLNHRTDVPYSIEMIEADLVPLDLEIPEQNVSQGVARNTWGAITGYHVYKSHPGDGRFFGRETKYVSTDVMSSLAIIDRIHQVRGLSVFASTINRLRDISDYENSERIAAKVAASFCAQIVKDGSAIGQVNPASALEAGAALDRVMRSLTMVPGMIGDDLEPGEKIEVIDSKRPNPNIATYLDSQLRRAAGGFGVSFSSLSLNYNGSYSAQRQELVEKFGYYAMLGEWFTARFMRPIWSRFCEAAVLRGLIKLPKGWTMRELSAAMFIRPAMPWIDPLKEILARGEQVDRGWKSPQQAILESGADPEEVQRLIADWNETNPQVPAQPGDLTPEKSKARRDMFVAAASGATHV